jgi:hypothetical protein
MDEFLDQADSLDSMVDFGDDSGLVDNSPEQNELDYTTPENQDTPPEKTFTQTDIDRIIGERLSRERQKYTPYEQLISNEARKYNMTPDQYIQAIQQQEAESERQRYVEAGLDPDLVDQRVANHPAVQWAQQFMTKQQQEQQFQSQAMELLQAFPELDTKSIPPEVFKLQNQENLTLLDAYNRVMAPKFAANRKQIEEEAVKNYLSRKGSRVGVTESGSATTPIQEVKSPKTFEDAKQNALAFMRNKGGFK